MVLSLGLKLWVADVARCLSVNHSSCLHFFRKAKCSTKNPCFSRLFKRQVTQLWDDVSGGPLGASKGASCLGCRSDTAVAPGEAKSKRTRALLPTEAGIQKNTGVFWHCEATLSAPKGLLSVLVREKINHCFINPVRLGFCYRQLNSIPDYTETELKKFKGLAHICI